jgi:putative hydrolase of the HAD superfamily
MLDTIMHDIAAATRVTPDAHRVLDELHTMGIAVAIITNGFTALQAYKARAHGLEDRVDFIVTSEDAGAHKPDPRIFHMALSKASVCAERAWYVGDSLENDVRGCTLAGMLSVLFDPTSAYQAVSYRVGCNAPSYVARELLDVPAIIRGMG